jgi:hypothetical protein
MRLETERFSKDAICSSFVLISHHDRQVDFALFLFFLDFAIRMVSFAADMGL